MIHLLIQNEGVNASGAASASGSASINPYEEVGPTFQTAGYGWGTYLWGRFYMGHS